MKLSAAKCQEEKEREKEIMYVSMLFVHSIIMYICTFKSMQTDYINQNKLMRCSNLKKRQENNVSL